MVIIITFVPNQKIMKKTGLLFLLSSALLFSSCGTGEDTQGEMQQEVEKTTYNLDAEAASLQWKATEKPEGGHNGEISVTNGSVTMQGDNFVSGEFSIDMNSIAVKDLDDPLAGVLAGHLKGTMVDERHPADLFFNVPKFPETKVTIDGYSDGKMDLTLSILGKELKQSAAILLEKNDGNITMNGSFELDFSSLNIPGLQPNPEDGSGINPNILFDLNLTLNK
jgi:hypothetical protein